MTFITTDLQNAYEVSRLEVGSDGLIKQAVSNLSLSTPSNSCRIQAMVNKPSHLQAHSPHISDAPERQCNQDRRGCPEPDADVCGRGWRP